MFTNLCTGGLASQMVMPSGDFDLGNVSVSRPGRGARVVDSSQGVVGAHYRVMCV